MDDELKPEGMPEDEGNDLLDDSLLLDEEDFDEDYDVDMYPMSESPLTDAIENTIDNMLEVASVEAVYGAPVEQGDMLIIPAAEVTAMMGFGMGMGSGEDTRAQENDGPGYAGGSGSGGGGGGTSFARPVAVIIAGPDGVRVEPVIDLTKIALAGLTAGIFMIGLVARANQLRGQFNKVQKQLSKL
jgi:uncharacterized spore protein YtfJ